MTLDQRDGPAGLRNLRGAVGASVLFSALSLVGLGIGWAWLFHRTSQNSALEDAGQYGALAGRAALAPFITDKLLTGDQTALVDVARAGQALITQGGAKHVKVWSADGKVLWSDEPRLIGKTFGFDDEEKKLLGTKNVLANVSSLDEDENEFEIAEGEKSLLQVYFGWTTPTDTPMLVETYYPTSLVDDRAAAQRHDFLPLLLGGLALLVVAQLPVGVALTHRLRKLQTEREHLLERVIASSDTERRRIAAEVHDGAVQELIGITFSLSAAAEESEPPMSDRLDGLAVATRHTVRSLRSLLNSIYPVEVPERGWAAGLDDTISALRQRGVIVNVKVPELRLSPANEIGRAHV